MRRMACVDPARVAVLVVVVVVVVAAAAGCREAPATGEPACRTDEDCARVLEVGTAADHRCEASTGVCYCRTDAACGPRQFCNTSGFCQDRTGCTRNSDCLGSGLFCDTTTGGCLTEGRCTHDLHCRIGQVCDTPSRLCVEGCRSGGDCNGTSCNCDGGPCGCTGTTEAERAQCAIGVCDPAFCESDAYCRYGEKCGVPQDAGAQQCYSDYDAQRRPYCKQCTFGGGREECGRGSNFCLVDQDNAGSYFCGVDCSGGQACPKGYACSNVVQFLTGRTCGTSKPCPFSSVACTKDADCPGGTACSVDDGGAGFCVGACMGTESGGLGVCGCVTDSDCFGNTCTANACSATGTACVTDSDCQPVRCVQHGEARGCQVGQNCAPASGLSCFEVR